MDILVSENITDPAMAMLRRNRGVAFEPESWRDWQRLQEKIGAARARAVGR